MLKIKFVLFLFIINIFNLACAEVQNRYESITYNIKLSSNKKYLIIKAKYKGDFYKKETIDLPYKWGDKEYCSQIKNIVNVDKKNKFFINQEQANQLVIDFAEPTKQLEINYEVHPKQNQNFDIKGLIIYNDLIHVPGHAILAVPENVDDIQKLRIKLTWEELPKKWKILSTHGRGKSLIFSATIFELLHSIYIAGIIRERVEYINDRSVNFSLYGKFDFVDEQIINNILKIIKSQRSFFGDYDFNNYLISIIENTDNNKTLALMGGINLHNSFVAHMSKDISLKQYQVLFAHEHLHNWIGTKIQNSEEILNYWWSEGFTDYYSRVIAARNGTLSFNDLILEMNSILEEYYKSSVINLTNIEINKNFWNNYDTYKIPYLRGFVFALYLNCKLKSKNPLNSIDMILMDFWRNHKIMYFSNDNFIKLFKKYDASVQNIEKWFSDYIEKGQVITINDCCFLLPIRKRGSVYYFPTKLDNNDKERIINFFNL